MRRRPRSSSAAPVHAASFDEFPPPPAVPLGSSRSSLGGQWRPAFPSGSVGPDWLGGGLGRTFMGGRIGQDYKAEGIFPGLLQSVRGFVLQLIFWPLTFGLMLTGTLYRFMLRVGTSSCPLTFRDPSRWLVQAVSWPFRLANPPVVLGANSLRNALSCQEVHGNTATMQAQERDGIASSAGRGNSPPILLVGNHTVLGLDCVPILDEVQGCTGVYPRVLYDTLFGYIPGWRQIVEAAGGSKGTLGNCDALMSEGRCLMLYPGGAKEAMKRTGATDNYKLMWDDKMGFVRMAVKHGYSLLPFASVGLEDAVSVAFTMDITWIVQRLEGNRRRLRIPFLYPYNSLQRQYFAFGEAIDTSHYGGDWENAAKCLEVYTKVKGEVERLIQHLKRVQELDPGRYVLRRAWRYCRKMVGGLRGKADGEPSPDLKCG